MNIDADNPAIEQYYATLLEYKNQQLLYEGAVSTAFENLLTVEGILREAFDYVLGTRPALNWVVDQYRLEEDEVGNVTSEPNDDKYIVHLIERVTTVSIETLALIGKLPQEMEFVTPDAKIATVAASI